MEIYFATRNKYKLNEGRKILPKYEIKLRWLNVDYEESRGTYKMLQKELLNFLLKNIKKE